MTPNRLEPRAPYISPLTVITDFTKERLSSSLEHWYGTEKFSRRLKLARGVARCHTTLKHAYCEVATS